MQDVGAGWLMTSLSPTPLMVSLVQTAITVPMFLLAIPAGAMRTGLRYVKFSSPLKATLFRGGSFFLFGSVIWALLPLISRQQIGGGPETYGLMVGSMGAGAVMGALNLSRLRKIWSGSRIVQVGSLVFVVALLSLSQAQSQWHALPTVLVAGAAWLSVLSTVFVAAQLALPRWVRGRGISVCMSVFMGCLALGSLMWGTVANVLGLSLTVIVAAVGLALLTLISTRIKLPRITDDSDGLEPSRHWQLPETRVPVSF